MNTVIAVVFGNCNHQKTRRRRPGIGGRMEFERVVLMKSVLVDFYNLWLNLDAVKEFEVKRGEIQNWHTPEADRKKMLELFERHAPEILDSAEIIGTLGYFEHRTKQSWFDFNIDFYHDYEWVHRIIDSHLEEKTHDGTLAFLNFLLRDVRMFTQITSKKDGRKYGGANAPKQIDRKDYVWGDRIGTIRTTSRDPSKVRLNLGGLRFKLRNEFLALLNDEIEVRKCDAEDCENIFIPTPRGKEQRYCSMRCRKRSYMREYRKNFS